MYHKRCYVSKRRRELPKTDDPDSTIFFPVKKTRKSYELSFNNSYGVLCQKNTKSKGKVVNFATGKASDMIRKCLETTADRKIVDRLRNIDLVAAEVKYHKTSYLNFLHNSERNAQNNSILDTESSEDQIQLTDKHFEDRIMRGKLIE